MTQQNPIVRRHLPKVMLQLLSLGLMALVCAPTSKGAPIVAAGDYFTIALRGDGTVWSWGANSSGMLGDGSGQNQRSPVRVANLSGVVAIAAGATHSLALTASGQVWAWGGNSDGELGDGTTSYRTTPVQVLSGVESIAAGRNMSFAVKTDGTVMAWGRNQLGQLGTGDQANKTTPTVVNGIAGRVVALRGGNTTGMALTSAADGGQVWGWGQRINGLLGVDSPTPQLTPVALSLAGVKDVRVGNTHALALKSDNTVWAWGANNYGQLGNNTTIGSSVPAQINGLSQVSVIGAGNGNSLAITSGGNLWTWGFNMFGKLGDGTTVNRYLPFQVTGLGEVTDTAAGLIHTIAVRNDQTVFSWGYNNSGQLGDLTLNTRLAPVRVISPILRTPGIVLAWPSAFNPPSPLNDAVAVNAGDYHSLALKSDATLVAWGSSSSGQTTIPAGLTDVVDFSVGWEHSIALKKDGTVVTWGGYNEYGELNIPPGLSGVTSVRAGYKASLALKSDGTVVAWGLNAWYKSSVPSGLADVMAISAGFDHNLALKRDGTVVAWGGNTYNQLSVPAGLSNVRQIAAGSFHNLALKADGTVVAWGSAMDGALTIPANLQAVAVAAGSQSSQARKADGTLVTWGRNPAPFAGLTGVSDTEAGQYHGVIVRQGPYTPLISVQPVNTINAAGASVTFSVTAISPIPLSYQWQFNGQDLAGKTSSSLVLNNVQAAQQGSYRVRVSNAAGVMFSDAATFTLLTPPVIIAQPQPSLQRVNAGTYVTYSVTATAMAESVFPLSYQWQRNGVILPGSHPMLYSLPFPALPQNEGVYRVTVSNPAGSVVSDPITLQVNSPGSVRAWGYNANGQTQVPFGLTDVSALAASFYHALAVKVDGTVVAWGADEGITPPANLTDVVSVACGYFFSLALKRDGTVVAWGNAEFGETDVPPGLNNVVAIATAGYRGGLAVKKDGTVVAWGDLSYPPPPGLSGVVAVAAGDHHNLALKSDGTVVSWGENQFGQGTIPPGLGSVVAIAAGTFHSMALKSNGEVVCWGWNDSGACTLPAGLNNVLGITAGYSSSYALKNDGTVVAWGYGGYGQTTVPTDLPATKLLAAGGNSVFAASFNPKAEYYPLDVKKDLLIVYRANSPDSVALKNYYMAHRPMIGNANVLPVTCQTFNSCPDIFAQDEAISMTEADNVVIPQVLQWLQANPTKRPQYMVFLLGMPTTIPNQPCNYFYRGTTLGDRVRQAIPGIKPFINYINMGDLAACMAYVDKLAAKAQYAPGDLVISASRSGYPNDTYYFDGILAPGANGTINASQNAVDGVLNRNPNANIVHATWPNGTTITSGSRVAAFFSGGAYTPLGGDYVFDIDWEIGSSDWWILLTNESFNAYRIKTASLGNYIEWFSANAFGGAAYSNTPVGAIGSVTEPGSHVGVMYDYYGLWAGGRYFSTCAWSAIVPSVVMVMGDPFVTR